MILLAVLAAGTELHATPATNASDGDVPVSPIAAAPFEGWAEAFHLKNDAMEVVAVPAIGRIVFLGPGPGQNILRLDEGLTGQTAGKAGSWLNFGGDWLWPVAQSRWPEFQGKDWPPSRLLDGRPWQGHAWKSADGAQCCLLTQEYGAPLHITVSRLIRLPPGKADLVIHQSVERTSASTVAVTLWNISQIAGAERIVLAVDEPSAFEGGLRPMMFGDPDPEALTRCGQAAVFDARAGGEKKLCSDSARAWIAAQKGRLVIIERATSAETGPYPDGGCSIEMYSNAGLGYAEIETLSPEQNLEVGDVLENELQISCRELPAEGVDACGLARLVQGWLGEPLEQAPATAVPSL